MTVRKRKKKNKLRGKRTHGKGNTKNKRGGGSRGGRGKAGARKHKKDKYSGILKKKARLKPKKKGRVIDIDELSRIAERLKKENKAEYDNEFIIIDGKKIGFEKILSRGKLTHRVKIINAKISERARRKILESGGLIEEMLGERKEMSGEKKV
ncbi:MAG: uL15 family ribosomal protein [Candidatus Diapherotrites archaeon]|nr:uL15 family ribosomal protein [Candidatus Diapherotrites archaeon]